jgi:UDP-N-acetylglucosamine--N-acetylmuramyl-(pentapeptide) pyrophosphoryl-undecaprenol N-acetylglucosamine transferase
MSLTRPFLIMAGGTGGHVFPGLAVAEQLQSAGASVVWLGSRAGMEAKLVPERGLRFEAIDVSGLRGKGIMKLLWAPWLLLRALLQALKVMRRHRPACVLSFGGFAAGPGGVAAWLMRLPLLVHEQNQIAGFTNRCLAKLAKLRLQAFSGALAGANTVGNPVRASIDALAKPAVRFAGREGPLQLLVLGGSLGARVFNTRIPEALALLAPADRPIVKHQCGARWQSETEANYQRAQVAAEVQPFIADMAQAYGWADLAICRAGALTISELTHAGLSAVLVPYPHAVDDHQSANARWLASLGAAQVLAENDASAAALAQAIQNTQRQHALAAAEKNRSLARPNSAQMIAHAALQLARGERPELAS